MRALGSVLMIVGALAVAAAVLSLFGPHVDRAQTTPALIEGIPHLLSRRAAN